MQTEEAVDRAHNPIKKPFDGADVNEVFILEKSPPAVVGVFRAVRVFRGGQGDVGRGQVGMF